VGENREAESRRAGLARICRAFHVATLHVLGSQGGEALEWVEGERQTFERGPSDVDVGVRPISGMPLAVEEKVRLAIALEDLFDVRRVDVVSLSEADPFLAANVVRGERLYARDEDEYEADAG
jgi:hypothetical protein